MVILSELRITNFNSSPEILRQITLFSIVKVHEARDEIPVKYYQKLQIALFCICAPLGIYANMQVKEVIWLYNLIKFRNHPLSRGADPLLLR